MGKFIELTIPEPCHENWEKMTAAEKGRFCAACQKNVIDFTRMNDEAIAAFFRKPTTGSVCGRFVPGQLDRDLEIPRKKIPWVKYFFQVALPAFLWSAKATAQGGVIVKQETVATPEMNTIGKAVVTRQMDKVRSTVIKGMVIDATGGIIPYATLTVKGMRLTTITNSAGYFELKYNGTDDSITLQASCTMFQPGEIRVDLKHQSGLLTIQLDLENEIHEIEVIAGMIAVRPVIKKERRARTKIIQDKVAKKEPPALIRMIQDTIAKNFKIFPNPVMQGASLHIEWKKMNEGYYILELLNQGGNSVYRREIWVDETARLLDIEVPSLAAGQYFLSVTGKESGKGYTEKVIIQ